MGRGRRTPNESLATSCIDKRRDLLRGRGALPASTIDHVLDGAGNRTQVIGGATPGPYTDQGSVMALTDAAGVRVESR